MSSEPLERLVNDLLRATGLLIRRARAEHPHQISIAQLQVMSRLAEAGPLTTADLARAEAVKPQSMGATLVPLEQEGLVARDAHPTDGRQMLVRLTQKGEDVRRSNKLATRNWLTAAIGRLPPDERHTLAAAVKIMQQLALPDTKP
jgi:DNA-binding MarR family transcriptional regulator